MPGTDPARRDALPAGTPLREYTLEAVVGHGGFGIVYRAQHDELGSTAAIKEYLPIELAVREGVSVRVRSAADSRSYQDSLRRFRDEARALMQLQDHPGIVSCRDFFRANGTAYMVMEYEEGRSLAEVLATREAAGRPFEQADLLRVMVPLLEGLQCVHEAGLLHRDIKPSNILIRRVDGRPVLIDFGASKQVVAHHSKSMAPYTEGYAAMEQVAEAGELGPWTDMYGVGAVMWRMVAGGQPPWQPPHPMRVETRSHAVLRNAEDPLPSAAELGQGRFSQRLLGEIDRCLILQEERRVQDCRELLGILRAKPTSPKDPPFNPRAATVSEAAPTFLSAVLRADWMPVSSRALFGWVLARITGLALPLRLMLDLRPPDQVLSCNVLSALEGDPTAQYGLGEQYRNGMRMRQYYPKALQWYRRAAEQGHAGAQCRLGEFHYHHPLTLDGLDYTKAVEWYRRAAEQGHAEAQGGLAGLYLRGKGVKQDYTEGVKWLRRAAEQGLVLAYVCLGHCSRDGEGVRKNPAEAAEWYRRAAERDHAGAQYCLGLLYERGHGIAQDLSEAARWHQKAAEQDEVLAQYRLAGLYGMGKGVRKDSAEAAKWYRRAAEQGHPASQYWLGSLYEKGKGVIQDRAEAVRWYRRAAEQDHVTSQYWLGSLYEKGEGVKRNRVKAAKWYRRAAEQGDTESQLRLAGLYGMGKGGKRARAEAAKWCQRAAEQGDYRGQYSLAVLYEKGWGVTQDYAVAKKWYWKAAERGLALAQYRLGDLYRLGNGVAQDRTKAAHWYRKAADQHHKAAQEALDLLEDNADSEGQV